MSGPICFAGIVGDMPEDEIYSKKEDGGRAYMPRVSMSRQASRKFKPLYDRIVSHYGSIAEASRQVDVSEITLARAGKGDLTYATGKKLSAAFEGIRR